VKLQEIGPHIAHDGLEFVVAQVGDQRHHLQASTHAAGQHLRRLGRHKAGRAAMEDQTAKGGARIDGRIDRLGTGQAADFDGNGHGLGLMGPGRG